MTTNNSQGKDGVLPVRVTPYGTAKALAEIWGLKRVYAAGKMGAVLWLPMDGDLGQKMDMLQRMAEAQRITAKVILGGH